MGRRRRGHRGGLGGLNGIRVLSHHGRNGIGSLVGIVMTAARCLVAVRHPVTIAP